LRREDRFQRGTAKAIHTLVTKLYLAFGFHAVARIWRGELPRVSLPNLTLKSQSIEFSSYLAPFDRWSKKMQILDQTKDGLSTVAQEFNARSWLKQGTWTGSFLWFTAIMESFSQEWTGQVLDPGLAIRDYACIGQPHGAYDCLIGAACFGEIRAVMERAFSAEGSQYFREYSRLCEQTFESWLEYSRSIAQRAEELPGVTNAQLADMVETYLQHLRKNGAFIDTIIVLADLLGDVVGTGIDDLLRASGVDDPAAYGAFLEAHSEPPLPTSIGRAEDSIRELTRTVRASRALSSLFTKTPTEVASRLIREFPAVSAAVEKHRAEFGWLQTYSFLGEPYTAEQVIQFIQENLDNNNQMRTRQQHAESPMLTQMRTLRVSPEVRGLLDVVRSLTYVNAAKDDAHQITWQHVRPLMGEIARRLNCTPGELVLCTPRELIEALKGGALNREFLDARAQNWILLKTGDLLNVVQGLEPVEVLRKSLKSILPSNVSTLTGRPIYPGSVRGQARIVLTSADCSGVKPGDILVATNTNPDFIPAMRRAAAFITDTGNLICHAVIAAREFQKPCVISTQIATQLLKDGELLEVDGTTGVITRLDVQKEATPSL
jgi:phosphohistidine swiveling domain-containing protein